MKGRPTKPSGVLAEVPGNLQKAAGTEELSPGRAVLGEAGGAWME